MQVGLGHYYRKPDVPDVVEASAGAHHARRSSFRVGRVRAWHGRPDPPRRSPTQPGLYPSLCLETAIEAGFLAGRYMRLTLGLLVFQMAGTLTPLALFPA
jgi:hypothetical protein